MFRDIDQEERIVDESRKALLTSEAKYTKLLKQVMDWSSMCVFCVHVVSVCERVSE